MTICSPHFEHWSIEEWMNFVWLLERINEILRFLLRIY